MQKTIQHINQLMKERKADEAIAACHKLITMYPDRIEGWLHLGWISQSQSNITQQLDCARKAVTIEASSISGHILLLEGLMSNGQLVEANKTLKILESLAGQDARLWSKLGEIHTQVGNLQDAYHCYDQARILLKDEPQTLYNCASAALAVGKLTEADAQYSKVIKLNPSDCDAYYNRTTVQKQTQNNNHIQEIKTGIEKNKHNQQGLVPLYYALAKEYEDLGENASSFSALKSGADLRGSLLNYDVQDDVSTMAKIAECMAGPFFSDKGVQGKSPDNTPIFILGLPRSGTTLVERILVSHSEVESLGEAPDFAMTLTRLAGKVSSKEELIERSISLDFDALGDDYTNSTRGRGIKAPYLIDKTPANFLYIGLIAKALPNAKIIHLRRNPMDSCYAMYKTLFRMGYPFSYTQEDLGAYYVAYHGLMEHWRRELPDRILDVDYEALVSDQEVQSRRMIGHCGLEWEEACLDFHKNKSASATASAAQVRQPIYKSSVEKWRHYESELAPLKAILEEAGIAV